MYINGKDYRKRPILASFKFICLLDPSPNWQFLEPLLIVVSRLHCKKLYTASFPNNSTMYIFTSLDNNLDYRFWWHTPSPCKPAANRKARHSYLHHSRNTNRQSMSSPHFGGCSHLWIVLKYWKGFKDIFQNHKWNKIATTTYASKIGHNVS